MFCHNCGTQLREDARFCHVCGAEQMLDLYEDTAVSPVPEQESIPAPVGGYTFVEPKAAVQEAEPAVRQQESPVLEVKEPAVQREEPVVSEAREPVVQREEPAVSEAEEPVVQQEEPVVSEVKEPAVQQEEPVSSEIEEAAPQQEETPAVQPLTGTFTWENVKISGEFKNGTGSITITFN